MPESCRGFNQHGTARGNAYAKELCGVLPAESMRLMEIKITETSLFAARAGPLSPASSLITVSCAVCQRESKRVGGFVGQTNPLLLSESLSKYPASSTTKKGKTTFQESTLENYGNAGIFGSVPSISTFGKCSLMRASISSTLAFGTSASTSR